jgi:regulator of replication initiation timing
MAEDNTGVDNPENATDDDSQDGESKNRESDFISISKYEESQKANARMRAENSSLRKEFNELRQRLEDEEHAKAEKTQDKDKQIELLKQKVSQVSEERDEIKNSFISSTVREQVIKTAGEITTTPDVVYDLTADQYELTQDPITGANIVVTKTGDALGDFISDVVSKRLPDTKKSNRAKGTGPGIPAVSASKNGSVDARSIENMSFKERVQALKDPEARKRVLEERGIKT